MPDIQDQKLPYEILIRFGEDGEPKGAHACWRRRVSLDGELLKDDVLPAVPLGLKDFPASAIMSEVTAAALARIPALEAEVAAKDEVIAGKDVLLHELVKRWKVAIASIDALAMDNSQLRAVIEAAAVSPPSAEEEVQPAAGEQGDAAKQGK